MFSVYPFPLWWLREYILCLFIIKLEVWTITHSLGLGHETMVSAVCLSIFLFLKGISILYICGRLEPPGTATCGDCTTATVQIFSYLVQVRTMATNGKCVAITTIGPVAMTPQPTMHAVSGSPQLPLVRCLGRPCVAIIGSLIAYVDTPFQVTPHYCLLSPMHPIHFWCFNTFSWHVSNQAADYCDTWAS